MIDEISFQDFQKLDLRIGRIISCEDVPGADKLYKLEVDIGKETRTLIAGLKPYLNTDDIAGKKVLMLVNLAPRKIRGIESHGMILAAVVGDIDDVVLITPDKDVPPGTTVA